ncbi:MAG: hypothetical protein SPLM_05730 [Spiroplasma phoeniceum]
MLQLNKLLIYFIILPMTNITIAYFLIFFFMIIKLSIYAIHGTSTNYNDLGSTVKSGVINSSKLIWCYCSGCF